jgi:hypothetical protein
MLRIDLDAAGIPYVIQGTDGPLYADFHALRHSYIANLKRAGVSLTDAMALARHSDPKLTAVVYGKVDVKTLGPVVNRLPNLRASAESLPPTSSTCTTHVPTVDSGSGRMRSGEEKAGEGDGNAPGHNPLPMQEVEARCGSLIAVDEAPRPGLEPGTNRLTGADKSSAESLRKRCQITLYINSTNLASPCEDKREKAWKHGRSSIAPYDNPVQTVQLFQVSSISYMSIRTVDEQSGCAGSVGCSVG